MENRKIGKWKMENKKIENVNRKWKMEMKNGNGKWKQKMENENGNSKWKMEIENGMKMNMENGNERMEN